MRRQDLIFALLQHTAANKGEVYGDGVLETLPDDPPASVALARARIALGDVAGARALLAVVERVAPSSPAGAEPRSNASSVSRVPAVVVSMPRKCAEKA